MKKNVLLLFVLFVLLLVLANSLTNSLQSASFRILFVGNSFTHMNNFPDMLSELATAGGDTVFADKSAVDSYTLEKHSKYSETLTKISAGCWDYVVLQEQSQRPVMDSIMFYNKTLYYASYLDSIIKFHNPNAQVLLFMTWGRKNGDDELCGRFPMLCSYDGMQKKLAERYNLLGSKLAMSVIPCGLAWEYFHKNEKNMNLYDEDFKHANIIGSYLNACVFYSALLKKSPEGLKYNPANLTFVELFLVQMQAYVAVVGSNGLFNSIRNS